MEVLHATMHHGHHRQHADADVGGGGFGFQPCPRSLRHWRYYAVPIQRCRWYRVQHQLQVGNGDTVIVRRRGYGREVGLRNDALAAARGSVDG